MDRFSVNAIAARTFWKIATTCLHSTASFVLNIYANVFLRLRGRSRFTSLLWAVAATP
jgi:hypothetical protein